MPWQTASLPPAYDLLAPDGSEIRLLVQVNAGSLVHCTLQPGAVTQAIQHRSVEEVWYCLAGSGQLWRSANRADDVTEEVTEEVTDLAPGVAITLPLGTRFQFRANGSQPLEVVITTLPPWPGADEAIPVAGPWTPSA